MLQEYKKYIQNGKPKMNKDNFYKNYSVEIDQIDKSEWTELLQAFDDASIYQTWSYGSVRWGENNLSHIVIKKEVEVIGLAQLCIKKIPGVGYGIAYSPWGPLWQRREKTNSLEDMKYLIKALKEEYVIRRGLLLRVSPNIVDDGTGEMKSIFENCGFRLNNAEPTYRTLMVDLTPTLEELRKGLNQKWRNQLNRAEKNGLTVIEGNSDELYHKFMELLNEMLARKKFRPGVDYEEFREIQENLPEPLKMKIIVCEYEGDSITATICTAIGNTGIYLLGATGDKGLELKGSYLSQWLMIQWLKKRGCGWYDLGGINPEKNPGVYHFKAGLSGVDKCHIGQFEACQNVFSTLFVFLANRLNNIVGQLKTW